MGASSSVLNRENNSTSKLAGNIDKSNSVQPNVPDDTQQQGTEDEPVPAWQLKEAIRKVVGSDEALRENLEVFHALLNELVNGHSTVLPLRRASITILQHTMAQLGPAAKVAGILVRKELLEPDCQPDLSFALIGGVAERSSLNKPTFTKICLEVSSRVLRSGASVQQQIEEDEHTYLVFAVPVFKYRSGELLLEFTDLSGSFLAQPSSPLLGVQEKGRGFHEGIVEQESDRDDDSDNEEKDLAGLARLAAVAEREATSDKAAASLADAERVHEDATGRSVGGIAVYVLTCPRNPSEEQVEKLLPNVKKGIVTTLLGETKGFIKKAIETEARLEYLFETQRVTAAAMDTSHLFFQAEDLFKAFQIYQDYICTVLSTRGCLVFVLDEMKKHLWHKRGNGEFIRVSMNDSTILSKSVLKRQALIGYTNGEGMLVCSAHQAGNTRVAEEFTVDMELHPFLKGEVKDVLCIPLLSDVEMLGVVIVVDKQVTAAAVWDGAIEEESTTKGSAMNQAPAAIDRKTSRSTLINKLELARDSKDGVPVGRSPYDKLVNDPKVFVSADVQLLLGTCVEITVFLESRYTEVNFLLSKHSEEDSDLVSLLESYNPEKSEATKKAQLGPERQGRARSISDENSKALVPLASYAYAQSDFADMDKKLTSWHMDVLAEPAEALVGCAVRLFEQFELLHKFNLDQEKLAYFFSEIKNAHLPNPYHNWHHGFSVLHATSLMLRSGIMPLLKVIDIFALFVAAVGHDVGHPGTNNDFQVNSGSEFAMTYNDSSVLENFHASTTFRIMNRDDINLLKDMSFTTRGTIRQTVIKAILSTDISVHFKMVSALKTKFVEATQKIAALGINNNTSASAGQPTYASFKNRRATLVLNMSQLRQQPLPSVERSGSSLNVAPLEQASFKKPQNPNSSFQRKHTMRRRASQEKANGLFEQEELENIDASQIFDMEQRADRIMIVEAVIHSADLANSVLAFPLYRKWTDLVVTEFYNQSLMEKKLGLPTLPHMCNPPGDEKALANLQLHFIDFVVAPLWSIMRDIFPELSSRYDQLELNRAEWKNRQKEAEEPAQPTSAVQQDTH